MTALLITLSARALGYVLAFALVAAVLASACNALVSLGTVSPGDYVPPTLAPFVMDSPTPAPKPTKRPKPTAKPRPAPAATAEPLDCGDMQPDDPNIDPEWDCVP